MIYSYPECLIKYKTNYRLNQALADSKIFKIEEGIYSDEKNVDELDILIKKYPNAILTGKYAFYVHELTDVIPDKYDFATKSKAAKITDQRVFQVYVPEKLYLLGCVEKNIDGSNARIYDKERMLIELLKNKNNMPYDFYKEILLNYRKKIYELDIRRIQDYAKIFPKSKMIQKALKEEVL